MKIEKIRFLEFGKPAPKDSRFKGVLDTDALIGWHKYTGREEAKEEDKQIDEIHNGFFGYTTSHTAATFSSDGELDTPEKKEMFKNKIAKGFSKKGDLVWDQVISLESHDVAEECSLSKAENWNVIVKKVMPRICKTLDLDESNVNWWFDFHVNTDHPHIHLVFMEGEHKTRKRGMIPNQKLENIKRYFFTEISARQDLQKKVGIEYKAFFKEKDIAFQTLLKSVDVKILNQNKIPLSQLQKILPKSGRLQYQSYAMKEYRPFIDKIITDIILDNPQLEKEINNWMDKIDTLAKNMDDVGNAKVSSIKQAEIKKLYTQVGNMILKDYKKKEYVEKKVPSKQKQGKKYVRKYPRKILTKRRIESAIYSAAIHQQQDMDRAIEEFFRRYEMAKFD